VNAHDTLEQLNEDAVARYLREHREFFSRHPRLLADLHLPHEAGRAVSLIERQVTLLRERNFDTRKCLSQLVDAAHANDALFAKTRHLTLVLLEARTVAEIDAVLGHELETHFGADDVACHYATPFAAPQGRHLVRHGSCASLPLPQLSHGGNGVICGAIRPDEYRALFGTSAGAASAALVGLTAPGLTGLLAIGSRNPNRFSPEMGPLFVRYVGDVLARVLQRSLEAPHERG
jgi:uncharacterized protein YigA (DUF484 family)